MTSLSQRAKGTYVSTVSFYDPLMEAGGIVIDNAAYGTKDRIYDVKGLTKLFIKLINDGEDQMTTKTDATQKEFTNISSLVDADFTKEIEAETVLDSGEFATGSVELTGGPSVGSTGTLTLLDAKAITPASGTVTLASALAIAFATGTITCATVLAADTVTVNGLVYTAVVGAKANNTEFSIDVSDNACAADLADSITNDARTGTLNDVTATSSTNVVTCTQTVAGASGNNTTLTSSTGIRLAVSGATFANGVDADTVTVNGLVYTAVAGAKANNTQFSIDTSNNAAATDLAASITADVRTPITVPSIDQTAASVGAVVTITASTPGTGGNAIDLSSSNGTRLAVSGAFLAGGLAADVATVNGLTYTAVAGAKANNTQFSISGSDTVDAADLADSINNDVRTPITEPTITVSATSALGVVTITADLNAGAAGNGVDISGTANITASGANLTGGVSSSMSGITVNAVQIMSGAVPFRDNLTNTATDIAANINAFASSPNYTAVAVGALITISATVEAPSTFAVVSTPVVLTKTDVNMSGGFIPEVKEFTEDVSGPEITAVRIRFKETSGGNPAILSGIVSAE